MKTLIMYYSYTGNTKRHAQKIAQQENADLIEIKDIKRPSTAGAYAIAAIRKRQPIEPIAVDFSLYDKIIIMSPVWGLGPAPAVDNVIELLPAGMHFEFTAVGGDASYRKQFVGVVERVAKKSNAILDSFSYVQM